MILLPVSKQVHFFYKRGGSYFPLCILSIIFNMMSLKQVTRSEQTVVNANNGNIIRIKNKIPREKIAAALILSSFPIIRGICSCGMAVYSV
jgi:hypothetical protein